MKTSNSSTINRQACEWIAKMHENELSETEHQELKAWLALNPENKVELRRMAKRWDNLNALTVLAVPADQKKTSTKHSESYFSLPKILTGATAIAALSIIMIVMWPQASLNLETEKELQSYATNIGEQRLVTLPDNSTVLLNTKSQFNIAYTSKFRDIYLIQGEAHFDVKSSAERPFRVFAGKSKVRAVGTAFSVRLKKATVDITVTHGSVEVDSIRDSLTAASPVLDTRSIVTAGEVAEFDQLEGTIETKVLPSASLVPAWHHGKLKFSGEPLEQVVEEISRYSPLSIVILDSELRNLRIGGSFDVGETKKMFDALSTGFGIRVEYINEDLVHLSAADADENKL